MIQSSECFCTNFETKSPLTPSLLQKLMADGRRTEHEREVFKNLFKSHMNYKCTRNGLISAREESDQIRSEHKNRSKVFDYKDVQSPHFAKPCSSCKCCSPSSIIKRHFSICQSCMCERNFEKYIKSRRKRFGSKMCAAMRSIHTNRKVCSAPCLPSLRRTFLIHSSTSDMKKSLSRLKSKHKNRIYENDNKSSFTCSANSYFNHFYPHQRLTKIKGIQSRPKEINSISMFLNKISPFSLQNRYQNNRIKMRNKYLVELKPHIVQKSQNLFSFDNRTSVFVPKERKTNPKNITLKRNGFETSNKHSSTIETDICMNPEAIAKVRVKSKLENTSKHFSKIFQNVYLLVISKK